MLDKVWISEPECYYKIEIESRKLILFPKILDLIKLYKPKRLIDYGCGDGSLLKSLDNTNIQLSVYDISKQALKLAKENLKNHEIVYYNASKKIPSKSFDCVIFSLVLMTIPSRRTIIKTLKELRRIKKKNGKLIITITHPCFRQYPYSTFFTEYYRDKKFNYFLDGDKFKVFIRDPIVNTHVSFYDYHWTLSTSINLILKNGLLLQEIIELPDFKTGNFFYNQKYPPYLLLIFQ